MSPRGNLSLALCTPAPRSATSGPRVMTELVVEQELASSPAELRGLSPTPPAIHRDPGAVSPAAAAWSLRERSPPSRLPAPQPHPTQDQRQQSTGRPRARHLPSLKHKVYCSDGSIQNSFLLILDLQVLHNLSTKRNEKYQNQTCDSLFVWHRPICT